MKKKSNSQYLLVIAFLVLVVVVFFYRRRNPLKSKYSIVSRVEHFFDRFSSDPYDDYGYDGIDVSKHNGHILWDKVASDTNAKFVYIKATQGDRIADKRYYENLRGAMAAGLLVGSYHFFTSKSSAVMQFLNFKNHATVADQDLTPVLDVEEGGIGSRWTREQIQDSVAVFVALVKEHYGKLPVIYSNEHYYNTMLAPRFNNHYLFIANYNGKSPTIAEDGRANLWQYSESGHIRGVGERVDLIRLVNGTKLEKLLLNE